MTTSIVLTVYNGEHYLIELLDSLRDQIRKADEVLIFDDRSTDDSVELIQRYIDDNQLTGWTIKVNPTNLGWEENFTQGLNVARGDIIFPCDQDDIWHLDKIEKMTATFEANDDILLLVSGYHAFSDGEGRLEIQHNVPTETTDLVSRVVFDEHYYQILRPGCTMAFRKEILPIFMKLWSTGTPHDALLWVIASIQRRLYLYVETFIEYRRHASNASYGIDHGYRYKVNEVVRTLLVNDYFLPNIAADDYRRLIVEQCSEWCRLREKLLIDHKRMYWFGLWKYRKYYLTNKKYLGDIYYSFQK